MQSGNVLHDRTGSVISEPEPQQPAPDTPAEACQQQAPINHVLSSTVVKPTRGSKGYDAALLVHLMVVLLFDHPGLVH